MANYNAALQYVLARCASQPRRFARPQPISQADLTAFRLLVGLSLVSVSARGAPVPAPRPAVAASQRRRFAHEEAWIKLDAQMDQYENQDLQDLALSHIPIQDIYATADATQASDPPLPCYEDALADALVKWFKPNFYEWADPIKCSKCGKGTKMREIQGPSTAEERNGGAGRVEIHECEDKYGCGGVERFPRFNDLRTMINQKRHKGRCGEFANVFALFIRAIGLRMRYVWNAEDHVWNEYYSPGLKRWVHLDSCENARDQHHIYSQGWGKKMSYCVAFSVDGGGMDVSRAYIIPEKWDSDEVKRMRAEAGSEEDGERMLKAIRDRRRFGQADSDLTRLALEDEVDKNWFKPPTETQVSVEGLSLGPPSEEGLEGRKSGTEEWKASRGESGK